MIGVAIAFAAGVLKNYALLGAGIAVELLLFVIAHERRDKRMSARLHALSEENTILFLKLERKEKEIQELKQVISRLRERLKSFAASEDEALAKVILATSLKDSRDHDGGEGNHNRHE